MTITKQTSQRMVIEWPDNLGDPTDANVLKALRDGTVDRETLYAISCLQQLRTTLGLQDRKEHGR